MRPGSGWYVASFLAFFLALGPIAPAIAQEAPPEGEAPGPQITKNPELIEFVEADYPEAALAEARGAEVVLQITIEADGIVSAAAIVETGGADFDAAAMTAVQRFRFSPAEIDGEPAPVQILYRYTFEPQIQVETVAADVETGRIEGRLRERGTRRPLIGFIVRLDQTELTAISDAEGRFVFEEVPVGEVTIVAEEAGYETVFDSEEVAAGQIVEVSYYLEKTDFTGELVTVIGRRPKKEVTRRTLTIEEIRTIPGTSGDALKVVQNLPGVARVPFGGGDLILRGGGNSLAFLDTQPIPQAFHFGALRSTVASALIESIDVYPGNFSPEFGRLAGGVVDVRLRRPKDDAVHGYAEADVFDAGALVEGPVGDDGAVAVAFRRSYIDAILPHVIPDDAGTQFRTAPRYYDGQLIYDWASGRHRLRGVGFLSDDKLVLVIEEPPEANPGIRGNARFDVAFWGGQLNWDYRLNEDVRHETQLAYLHQTVFVAAGREFLLDFRFHNMNLRDKLTAELTDGLELRVGLDAQLSYVDIIAEGEGGPPKEGDRPQENESGEFARTELTGSFFNPAAWAELEWKIGELALRPGFRIDRFAETEELAWQPRLSARYELVEDTAVKGGVGAYHQAPEGDEINDNIGNPNLTFVRCLHTSLGVEQRFSPEITLDLVGFYKDFDDVVTRDSNPEVRFRNQGIGRAYGLEVLLRHAQSERFYGWLAYTLQRSERRDARDESWRVFDFDQTHNLIAVAQYKLTPTWSLGMRWRYTTGNPTTPITGGVYDSVSDTYVPVSGKSNSDRLPPFHQLDVRVDKTWVFDTWRLTAYLDVQNAYNRANPELLNYNFNYSESDVVAGLPVIPSIGIRGEF